MLTVNWEPLTNLLAEGLEDLGACHWEEVEHDKKEVPFALDIASGIAMEKSGAFRIAALRRDQELVGYCAFIFGSLHAFRTRQAFLDAIYVVPEARGCGATFLKKIEALLRAAGVERFVAEIKPEVPLRPGKSRGTVGEFFKACGYEDYAQVYSKLL